MDTNKTESEPVLNNADSNPVPVDLIRCGFTDSEIRLGFYGVGFSVRGSDHVREDKACQDYSGLKIFKNKRHYCMATVVSDGHGSAKFGEDGSAFAVKTCFEVLERQLGRLEDSKQPVSHLVGILKSKSFREEILEQWKYNIETHEMNKGFLDKDKGFDGMSEKAVGEIIDQYGATLLFLIVIDNYIVCMNIGDGGLFLAGRGQEFVYPFSADGDDIGERTLSLSHMRADFFECEVFEKSDYNCAVLCTDGIGKPFSDRINEMVLHCRKEYKANPSAFKNTLEVAMRKWQPGIGDDISFVLCAF